MCIQVNEAVIHFVIGTSGTILQGLTDNPRRLAFFVSNDNAANIFLYRGPGDAGPWLCLPPFGSGQYIFRRDDYGELVTSAVWLNNAGSATTTVTELIALPE